jgi:hypothetical protein
MIIRLVDILVIILIIGFSIWWLLKTFVFDPRKQAAETIKNTTEDAIKEAEVTYLEIRKKWMGFYNLGKTQEFYAMSMDDISIPEVAKFQRMMVVMNQDYKDLTKDTKKTDQSFVGKVTALKEVFDDAVIAAKRHSL